MESSLRLNLYQRAAYLIALPVPKWVTVRSTVYLRSFALSLLMFSVHCFDKANLVFGERRVLQGWVRISYKGGVLVWCSQLEHEQYSQWKSCLVTFYFNSNDMHLHDCYANCWRQHGAHLLYTSETRQKTLSSFVAVSCARSTETNPCGLNASVSRTHRLYSNLKRCCDFFEWTHTLLHSERMWALIPAGSGCGDVLP